MPRAAFPKSATASQAGGATFSDWMAKFALFAGWAPRAKRGPEPTVSQAARVLSDRAKAARLAAETTIAQRRDAFHAQLRAEKAAGWPGPKVSQ